MARYSMEFRERGVRLTMDAMDKYASRWAAVEAIAKKLGCCPQTLDKWVKQAERDAGKGTGLTTDEKKPERTRAREQRAQAGQYDLAAGFRVFCPSGARPQTQVMVDFVEERREKHGVESNCKVLPIAPSTFQRHRAERENSELRSSRKERDEALKPKIQRVWDESFGGVYGARKVWRQLHLDGIDVARCTVERLMLQMGLSGVRRGRAFKVTTIPDESAARPEDLVERSFEATRPNHLWVADISVPQNAARERRDRPLAIGLQEQVANHRKRLG